MRWLGGCTRTCFITLIKFFELNKDQEMPTDLEDLYGVGERASRPRRLSDLPLFALTLIFRLLGLTEQPLK